MADRPVLPQPAAAARQGRRAVVHIGLNKTGSNSIYTWLDRNAAALRRQGVWFDGLAPHGGPAFSTATGWVVFARSAEPGWTPGPFERQAFRLSSRADLDARVATFLQHVEAGLPEGPGTYVTSAEMIGGLDTPEAIGALHGWFTARFDTVRYVVYLRDQVAWVASAYNQAIRAGETLDLDAFIARQGRNDYHALVTRWHAAVGRDALEVRLFDRRDFVRGDLIEDFAALIGAATAGTVKPPRKNTAMSALRLRATRAVSRLTGDFAARAGLLPLQRRLYRLPLPDFGAKLRLSDTQAAQVRAMNAEGNAKLAALLFPDRTDLFRDAPRAEPAVPSTDLSQVTGK